MSSSGGSAVEPRQAGPVNSVSPRTGSRPLAGKIFVRSAFPSISFCVVIVPGPGVSEAGRGIFGSHLSFNMACRIAVRS